MTSRLRLVFLAVILGLGVSVALPSGAQKKGGGGGVIEVQIPKPKFEIFRAWQYGGFWNWDEKDPRFFKEFLRKIHQSLTIGPF